MVNLDIALLPKQREVLEHPASVKNHELEFANLFAILVRLKEISKW